MELTRFQWWALPLWGGKDEGDESTVRKSGSVKFTAKGGCVASSSQRKVRKKWLSREERKVGKDHDLIVVPTDGVSLSGSETEDSDWSIGWLEPHGPDFLSDDETDDSFAVLVPCYRRRGPIQGANSTPLLNAIKGLTSEHFNEGQNVMEQWLSSLQTF